MAFNIKTQFKQCTLLHNEQTLYIFELECDSMVKKLYIIEAWSNKLEAAMAEHNCTGPGFSKILKCSLKVSGLFVETRVFSNV